MLYCSFLTYVLLVFLQVTTDQVYSSKSYLAFAFFMVYLGLKL